LVLLGTLAIGVGVAYAGVEPFRLLFIASIPGYIGTSLLLAVPVVVARDPQITGDLRIDRLLLVMGWLTFAVVGAASIAFLARLF